HFQTIWRLAGDTGLLRTTAGFYIETDGEAVTGSVCRCQLVVSAKEALVSNHVVNAAVTRVTGTGSTARSIYHYTGICWCAHDRPVFAGNIQLSRTSADLSWQLSVIVSLVLVNQTYEVRYVVAARVIAGVALQRRHRQEDDGQDQTSDGQYDHDLDDGKTVVLLSWCSFHIVAQPPFWDYVVVLMLIILWPSDKKSNSFCTG